MSEPKVYVFEINQKTFKMQKNARNTLEDYVESLYNHYKDYKDDDEILSGYKERIVEHLEILVKNNENKLINKEQVSGIIKLMGTVKTLKTESPEVSNPKNKKKIKPIKKILKVLAYIGFWVPHILWSLYVLGGSFILFIAILDGPEDLGLVAILTYIGALLVPTIGLIIGIYLTIKKNLRGMITFMLAIEIPLFLLSIFRIIILQAFSTVLAYAFLLIFFACLVLTFDVIKSKKLNKKPGILKYLRLTGYSIGSLMSGYVLIIWSFFFPYIATLILSGILEFLDEMFNFNPYQGGSSFSPFAFYSPFIILVFLILLGFYLSPLYVFPIYFKKFISTLNNALGGVFSIDKGKLKINKIKITTNKIIDFAVPVFTIGITLLVFVLLTADFQNKGRENVSEITKNNAEYTQIKEAYLSLYKNESKTKDVIKNKFLARYENLFDQYSKNMFNPMYCNEKDYKYRPFDDQIEFQFNEYFCDGLYEVFSFFAAPVIYNGDLKEDFIQADIEYKKVFDDNIQRAEAKDIRSYTSNTLGESVMSGSWGRSNNFAGLVDIDEKKVHLEKLEIESNINTEFNLQESAYTFTFKNKEDVNQEVFLEFSLPENSVITDLKLGTKLENPGIVAPKAAAKRVYETNVRSNIDPALLELIGPRTYRLRVFPIPPKNGDVRFEWNERTSENERFEIPNYQKVQFKFSGVVEENYELIKFSHTRNIDIDSQTDIEGIITSDLNSASMMNMLKSKVLFSTNRDLENSIMWSVDFNNKEKFIKEDSDWKYEIPTKGKPVCTIGEYDILAELNPSKNIRLFFDVSKSADSKKTRELYSEIISSLSKKHDTSTFEVHEFNFKANKFSDSIGGSELKGWANDNKNGLKFWGYSDTTEIIEVLKTNDNEDYITYVITDSSDFEFTEDSNYEFDYTNNRNNQINLIQVGVRLTGQKEELNNLVWGSNGKSYLIQENNDLKSLEDSDCEGEIEINEAKWSEITKDLTTLKNAQSKLSTIYGESSRLTVARELTTNAVNQHIVDPLHSMIAVEFSWQKEQLKREAERDDAFDEEFDIGEENLVVPDMFNGQSLPEADVIFTVLSMITLGGFLLIKENKFKIKSK